MRTSKTTSSPARRLADNGNLISIFVVGFLVCAVSAGSFLYNKPNRPSSEHAQLSVAEADTGPPSSAQRPQNEALRRPEDSDEADTSKVTPTSDRTGELYIARRECAQGRRADCEFLDNSPEFLQELAKCGAVWFDVPSILMNGESLADGKIADVAELTDSEKSTIREVERRFLTEFLSELERIGEHVDVWTDDGDKTFFGRDPTRPDPEFNRIRKSVSLERAGIKDPLMDFSQLSPRERYWRMVFSLGDQFEEQLSGEIGAMRARELRTVEDGFYKRAKMSGGCYLDDGD